MKRSKSRKEAILKFAALFLVVALALIAVALIVLAQIAKNLPSPEQFSNRQVIQSTKIYDRTGQVLLYEIHGEEKRTVVPFEDIPDYLKKATLAIEDQNFYNHSALDFRAIIRALITDIVHGRFVEGGSTITQQLAKGAFLTPEKSIQRKVKEFVLSYWLERTYNKDQILNLYLNQIPYGSNAYGVEAASETYFGKPVKDLDLAESAVLASLPNSPSYYSPWGIHIGDLIARKNYILDQMFKLGFVDEEERVRSQKEVLKFADQNSRFIKAPHFVMMVRDYLNNKYGEDVVDNGGLKVTTTLDYQIQQVAEESVKTGADRNNELYKGGNAALVAEDPKTGQILALVGSKDYFSSPESKGCTPGQNCQFEGNFNVASQGLRQPGSAFKPFAYITAFKKGYSPDMVVFDAPTEFTPNNPKCPPTVDFNNNNPECYHPHNFDGKFRGPTSFRNALSQSINIPSVKVLYLAGIADTLKTAQDFGITTLGEHNLYGLSLVLGGGEVKLIDMVGAYSVFSQDGIRHDQIFILKVEDPNSNTLEQYSDHATQVIEPQYPRIINDILSDTNARAPLFQSSLNLTIFPDREVALKTGTTNDYNDAWAMGYTPSIVVGVWAGNNNHQSMVKQGGSILAAVPIWSNFLNKILPNLPAESFNKPDIIPPATKPMLNGDASGGHNILYYVKKDDPLGPAPINPSGDPQSNNWEMAVRNWLFNNSSTTTP